jgi:DNA-binding response OmpR family regulator
MKLVLVVEDDFDTLHPLSELLRLKGYATLTASEIESGFRIACQRRPDLILTDIALPGRSGLQLILNVRQDMGIKNIPIIVISGCGPMMMTEARKAGANCCLEKPIDIDSLWEAMGEMLGGSRANGAGQHDVPEEGERRLATEIDQLVDRLRLSPSKEERDVYLKRLKERILELEARSGGQ